MTKERANLSSALDAAVLAAANNNAISLSEKDSYAEAHFLANYSGGISIDLTPSVTSSHVRLEAKLRAAITRTVQNMMVNIWMEHRALEDNTNDDEHADIAVMENQYQIAANNWQDYDDYDYDPWAPVNEWPVSYYYYFY